MNEVIEHYDKLVDEGNDSVHDSAPLREYMDGWDGQAFIDKMCLNKTKSVLEIGVGTGRLAVRVAPKCKTFTGIDISPKTIARAKENLPFDNTNLIYGDFLNYDFSEKFDVIFSSLTFMHFQNKSFVINKIASLLKQNGFFILSIDKNEDEYIDMGIRKIKIYPDSKNNTRQYILSSDLRIVEEFETKRAFCFVSTK